jgi:hypothetical protein
METIEMNVNYGGAPVEVKLYPEELFIGTIYPVEMEGNYAFTLSFNEDQEWSILREPNGITPEVDNELYKKILKNLQLQLKYAA